jgi:hypothetical protein
MDQYIDDGRGRRNRMTYSLRNARDGEFLSWVADRLVHVYGESPNVDFVLKLRDIAKRA